MDLLGKKKKALAENKTREQNNRILATENGLNKIFTSFSCNNKVALAAAKMHYIRSEEYKKALHSASRTLRGRASAKKKNLDRIGPFRKAILKLLGIYWVASDSVSDLDEISEKFRFQGDVQNKLTRAWVGIMLEEGAKELDREASDAVTQYGKETAAAIAQAGSEVRALRQLIDPSAAIKDNNEIKEKSESGKS